MQYNILSEALFTLDTVEGNTELSYYQLSQLSNYDVDPVFSLTASGVFIMDFDLGHRIHLDRLEYKYISPYATPQDAASGIEFYYKNDSYDTFTPLNTYIDNADIFYTTIEDELFAPRYLRLKHYINNTHNTTTLSGSVYGFKLFNDDSIVDFGTTGQQSDESIIASRATTDIRTIAIYNNGTTRADAQINLEPTFTDLDNVFSIGLTTTGPWVTIYDENNIIVNQTTFDYGVAEGTSYTNGPLELEGTHVNSGFVVDELEGVYTTPISIRSANTYNRLLIVNNGLDKLRVDHGDPNSTIEIRSSDTAPKDYVIIKEVTNREISGKGYLAFKNIWLDDSTVIGESEGYFNYPSASTGEVWSGGLMVIDQTTERVSGFAETYTSSTSISPRVIFYSQLGDTYTYKHLATNSNSLDRPNVSYRDVKLDIYGGAWAYFFCTAYLSWEFVSTTGYYLVYFNSNCEAVFSWFSYEDEVGAFTVNYNTGDLWYSKSQAGSIYKLNNSGDILLTYDRGEDTSELLGIAYRQIDDIVIYANGTDLHMMNNDGIYLDDMSLIDVATTGFSYIVLEGDGTEVIWVIDGSNVGRFFISGLEAGTFDFKVTIPNAIKLQAVPSGVWVHTVNSDSSGIGLKMHFVSKSQKKVTKIYEPTGYSVPSIVYQDYTHKNYINKMPLSKDTHWSNLEWNKIALDTYLISEYGFNQFRINLKGQTAAERYPDFISDPLQEYIRDDDFIQESSKPKQILWGNWYNYPNLDKIYVNNNSLVINQDLSDIGTCFINTKDRILYGPDETGTIELKIDYKIGNGNGATSNKVENFYLYLYNDQEGRTSEYTAVRLYIPLNPETSNILLYVKAPENNWLSYTVGTSLNYYEGTLRLYWSSSNSRIYGQVKSTLDTSYVGTYITGVSSATMDKCYMEIRGNKESSITHVDNVNLNYGKIYYYTETPEIESIYKQKLLTLEDVYPNNYKNIYLKTYVSPSASLSSDNNISLKVNWRVPLE